MGWPHTVDSRGAAALVQNTFEHLWVERANMGSVLLLGNQYNGASAGAYKTVADMVMGVGQIVLFGTTAVTTVDIAADLFGSYSMVINANNVWPVPEGFGPYIEAYVLGGGVYVEELAYSNQWCVEKSIADSPFGLLDRSYYCNVYVGGGQCYPPTVEGKNDPMLQGINFWYPDMYGEYFTGSSCSHGEIAVTGCESNGGTKKVLITDYINENLGRNVLGPTFDVAIQCDFGSSCSDGCAACESVNDCTSCKAGYIWDDPSGSNSELFCILQTDCTGTRVNNEGYCQCNIPNCGTCSTPESAGCLSCGTNFIFDDPSGTSSKDSCILQADCTGTRVNNEGYCQCNIPNCGTCSTPENAECLSCATNFIFDDPSGTSSKDSCILQADCTDTRVNNEGYCQCNIPNCGTCSTPENAECLSCATNFIFDDPSGTSSKDSCILQADCTGSRINYGGYCQCNIPNCDTCSTPESGECLSCATNYIFDDPFNSYTKDSCMWIWSCGYSRAKVGDYCQCVLPCENCWSSGTCQNCADTHVLDIDDSCVTSAECMSYGRYVYPREDKCVTSCPKDCYLDGMTCIPCEIKHPGCTRCSEVGGRYCYKGDCGGCNENEDCVVLLDNSVECLPKLCSVFNVEGCRERCLGGWYSSKGMCKSCRQKHGDRCSGCTKRRCKLWDSDSGGSIFPRG